MITKEQVEHIAKLSRMKLTDEEIRQYQEDLSEVLDYFEILQEANVEGVAPMTHVVLGENVTREDIPQREQPSSAFGLMQLAFSVKDGFLKVKEILQRAA